MICKIPYCRQSVKRYGLCQIHFKKSVRIVIKMIEDVRIKDRGYERFHVKENFSTFG